MIKITILLVLLLLLNNTYAQVCPLDVFQCPDGSSVGRDPNNNCEFLPCPGTPTITPSETGTEVPTDTATVPPTDRATEVLTDTDTLLPTETATELPTETATEVNTETATEVNTETATELPTETATELPTFTETATEVNTETATEVNTETATELPTEVNTETATELPTFTETATEINTETATELPTETATELPTIIPTETGTEIPTETATETATETGKEIPTETGTETGVIQAELEAEQLNSSCIYGTLLYGGHCACWSGAFGDKCEMGDNVTCQKIISNPWSKSISNIYENLDQQDNRDFCMDIVGHESCPDYNSWGVVKPLNTLNPPVMESANFEANHLHIIVSQPFVNGRADGAAFLNDNKQPNPFCSYPLSENVFKEVDGCKDIWNFSIPWDQAIQCGWNIEDQEGFRVYKGQVIIHNHEWLENLQEFRFVQSVLRIKIRFQLFIQVSLASVVYSQAKFAAAITKQIISINLGEEAIIQLTTVINYPYRLSGGELILSPADKIENSTVTSSDVNCDQNECRQRFDQALFLSNNTCTLDGDYSMNFTMDCQSSLTDCPLSDNDRSLQIDFTLVSENFCAEVSIEIGLHGSVRAFEDDAFSIERKDFIQGKKAYFLIDLNSDSNESPYSEATANIKLLGTKLRTVTVRAEDCILRLFENGSASSGSDVSEITRNEGNMAAFSLTFTDQMLKGLNCTNILQITIGAEVEVNYENSNSSSTGGGPRSSRRFVMETGTEKTTYSTTLTKSENDGSFGNVLIFGSLLFILMLLV